MDYDLRLIAEVRQHPEIYDNTHEKFKCKDVKQEIWSRIAYQLRQECDDESVRLVKMRWKSLRDTYVKEYNKHRKALQNGEEKPRRNWRYAQAMDFLSPYVGPPNPAKGVRRKMFIQTDNGLMEEIEPVEKYFVTPADLKEVSEDGSLISATSEWMEVSPETQIVASQIELRDDIDSFFQGVADTVKKLSPASQVQIQRDIVNMVLDVKLKEIEDKDPLNSS